jgi:ABC-type branched-subunit amino acid transport system permease subunit
MMLLLPRSRADSSALAPAFSVVRSRRWYQFTIRQMAFAAFWLAVAAALYADRSQRWNLDQFYEDEGIAIWAVVGGGIGTLLRHPIIFAILGAIIGFLVTPNEVIH